MEEYFKKIRDSLGSAGLSERERTDIRLSLEAFISEHPARMPLLMRIWHPAYLFSGVFSSRHAHFGIRAASMALVLVMAIGVGTSYAAEDALPGNPLYPVKISVDEPIERATVASSQSQTQWDITLANRRLEEAEKLASTGLLTPSNAAIVQTQLTAVTQNFDQSVASIATSTSDAATSTDAQAAGAAQVTDAQSDLEAALSAHEQVLAAIASSSPSAQTAIAPIIASVRAHASSARMARIAALAALDDSGSSTIKIAASGEMQDAESQLVDVRALVSATRSGNASTTSAQIGTDASDTAQTIHSGDSNLARGRFKQAFAAFQAATRSAKETQIDVQAQADLGASVTLPSVAGDDDVDDATSSDAAVTADASTSAQATSTMPGAIDDATGTAGELLGQ